MGLFIGYAVDVPQIYSNWKNNREPAFDIKYFTKDSSGNLTLEELSSIHVEIDQQNIQNSEILFPLSFAFHNVERDELLNARVVLSYPHDLKVDPEGKPRIDSNNSSFIYEHNLRDLAVVDEYTPLDTIDTLHIKFNFDVRPMVFLAEDGVPVEYLTIAGYNGNFEDAIVPIKLRFEVPGRPAVVKDIRINLKAGIEILPTPQSAVAQERPVTPEDISWFRSIPAGPRVVDDWEREMTYTQPHHKIHYTKLTDGNTTYQRISVDGLVKRILIDRNSDQESDAEIWDNTGDGLPDIRTEGGKAFMLDWEPEAVK
ncbi:hypothetical protein ACQ856_16080 [Mycolicibacterium psychrotolerans]|uniref:hypothetical protein n=1 Tax=Mycolicibacterium psychrotolerans TaxID=216929 RepID=UPI003D678DDC